MLPLTATRLDLDGTDVCAAPAGSLHGAAVHALRASARAGVVVLGEFGSGKTTLCTDLVDAPDADLPPCTVVPLGRLDARDPWASIRRIVGAPRHDEALDGRRILLLDGFDEIAPTAPLGWDELLDALAAVAGPRWLLTSRPGHVRTAASRDPDQADPLRHGHVTVLWVDPLDPGVVHDVLGALPRGEALLRTVDNLEALATSPLLLHIVRAAMPHIEEGRPIAAWALLDAWLRLALRTGPDHDDALARLGDIAWTAFGDAGHVVEATTLPPDTVQRARLPPALRRALFVTELDGTLRFGHRSVLEHLLAGSIAPRLRDGQGRGPDDLTGLRLTDALRAFLVDRVGRMPVHIERDRVRIPSGNYVAGGTRWPDERWLRIAHIDRPVWIARAPVTNAEWAAWDPDPDRDDIAHLPHWGRPRAVPTGQGEAPVYGVWPADADAYARDHGGRLPTADEWEKAVRGIDGRIWPWGDRWRQGVAATAELGLKAPLPVRALGATGDAALFGPVGGVFETTVSWWRGRPDRGRVVMGGCFTHAHDHARPSLRLSHTLSGALKCGLRLAWDAP